MQPLASISVDLDSLPHYCRIHGLDEAMLDGRARRLVYEVAIPRYLDLFDRLGVKGTFFAIGDDLEDEGCARRLAEAHAAGVEVGNHTWSHDYAVSRRGQAEIEPEVVRAEEKISEVTGSRPVGFRAPGYTLSAALLRVIEAKGYAYDSSTFPAVPYYAAKAGVMGALALLGRPSRAILDTPKVLMAPTRPYRPDPAAPYSRGTSRLLELPMTVAPVTRLPFIGTFAVAAPTPVARAVYVTARRTPHFNFELHGVDVLGEEDGIPQALVRQQRDLGIPADTKLRRLEAVFRWLRDDFEVLPLADVAARLSIVVG